MPQATIGARAVARGQDFTWEFTLEGDDSIAGSTLACRIRRRGSTEVLVAPEPEISDAATRKVQVTLTDLTSMNLLGDPSDSTVEVEHQLSVMQTLDGLTTAFGPFLFKAYTPA